MDHCLTSLFAQTLRAPLADGRLGGTIGADRPATVRAGEGGWAVAVPV